MKLTDILTHSIRGRERTPGMVDAARTRSAQFNPASLGNCILWYDMSNDTGSNGESITSITDKSGAGRNGSCVNVVRCKHPITGRTGFFSCYSGSYVSYTAASIRTVAIVADYGGGAGFLIADSSNYNWHGAAITCLNATYAANEVKNGSWRINGVTITPTSYKWSTSSQVITVVTTGNVSQNRLGYDRTYNNNHWKYYEVIFYSDAKTADQIRQLELYLADKWKVPLQLV
jgi:hypothetical protein